MRARRRAATCHDSTRSSCVGHDWPSPLDPSYIRHVTKRLIRLYVDTDAAGYVKLANDIWARLPDEPDVQMLLDSKASVHKANEDYRERYVEVPDWSADDAAESDDEAEALITRPRARRPR